MKTETRKQKLTGGIFTPTGIPCPIDDRGHDADEFLPSGFHQIVPASTTIFCPVTEAAPSPKR